MKRLHTILYAVEGRPASDIAEILGLSEQCVRNYAAFALKGLAGLTYQRPPGRAPWLTKTQKCALEDLLDKGPEQAGYDEGAGHRP